MKTSSMETANASTRVPLLASGVLAPAESVGGGFHKHGSNPRVTGSNPVR